MKYILIGFLLLAGLSSFSQSISKDDVINGLSGKWRLEYEGEDIPGDTSCVVLKRITDLKKMKGKEIGYMKDGSQIKSKIKYDFIESRRGTAIVFTGGFWVNEQDFVITQITKEKITMLSCGKHDNCDNVFLIKE
jgi:hypothetical protein